MKIFKNILSFLGKAESTAKVDLTEEEIEKIDTSLGELQSVKTERDSLKTENDTLKQEASTKDTTIATLTGERDTANNTIATRDAEIVRLNAEVTRLGALDGNGKRPKADEDQQPDAGEKAGYSEQQKQLFAKAY